MDKQNTLQNLSYINISYIKEYIRKHLRLFIFLLILIVLFISSSIYYSYSFTKNNSNKISKVSTTPTKTITPTQTITPSNSPTITPLLPTGTVVVSNGVQTYTGHGITFNVLTSFAGENINIQEVGDKVYVYTGSSSFGGSYVEILKKKSSDSLNQAITNNILVGYSRQDCLLVNASKPSNVTFLSSWVGASINYAQLKGYSGVAAPTNFDSTKCPSQYVSIGGSAQYFAEDTNHPSIYLYLSVNNGLYPASKTDSLLDWFSTIKIIG